MSNLNGTYFHGLQYILLVPVLPQRANGEVTGRKSQDEFGRCEVLRKIRLMRKTPRLFRSGELTGSTFRFFDIRPLFSRHEFFGRFQ